MVAAVAVWTLIAWLKLTTGNNEGLSVLSAAPADHLNLFQLLSQALCAGLSWKVAFLPQDSYPLPPHGTIMRKKLFWST